MLGFDPDAGPPPFETFFQPFVPMTKSESGNCSSACSRKAHFEADAELFTRAAPSRTSRSSRPSCLPNESGNLAEFVGTVIDVTETKRAEEALRASGRVARGTGGGAGAKLG